MPHRSGSPLQYVSVFYRDMQYIRGNTINRVKTCLNRYNSSISSIKRQKRKAIPCATFMSKLSQPSVPLNDTVLCSSRTNGETLIRLFNQYSSVIPKRFHTGYEAVPGILHCYLCNARRQDTHACMYPSSRWLQWAPAVKKHYYLKKKGPDQLKRKMKNGIKNTAQQ